MKEYISGFLEPVFSLGLFVIKVSSGTEDILTNFAGDTKLRGTELYFKIVLTIQKHAFFKKNKEDIQ